MVTAENAENSSSSCFTVDLCANMLGSASHYSNLPSHTSSTSVIPHNHSNEVIQMVSAVKNTVFVDFSAENSISIAPQSAQAFASFQPSPHTTFIPSRSPE